jgi:hypothetical protein
MRIFRSGLVYFIQRGSCCAAATNRRKARTLRKRRLWLGRLNDGQHRNHLFRLRGLSQDGNPSFETIRSILGAMGLRLTVEPAQAA